MRENEIISLVQKYIPGKPMPDGIGDDAALLENKKRIITTDSLVHGVHFKKSYFSPADIAHKLFHKNLSDIIIKGGLPEYGLLNLHFDKEWAGDKKKVTLLLSTLGMLFRKYSVRLIGGDSCRSPVTSLTLTMTGICKTFIPRKSKSIKKGNLVAIEGIPGLSDFALKQIRNKQKISQRYKRFHTRPNANMAFRKWSNYAIAAIDQSDSLHKSISLLANLNQLKVHVNLQNLPSHPWLNTLSEKKRYSMQISGAEDFASVAILDKRMVSKLPASVRILGWVEGYSSEGAVDYFNGETKFPLKIKDYEHFY